jgi:hypothetical protein
VRSYEHERTRSKRKLVARCDFDLVNDACAIHEGSIRRSEIPQKPATIDMTKKRVPCRNGRITHDQIARVKASDQDLRAHRQERDVAVVARSRPRKYRRATPKPR